VTEPLRAALARLIERDEGFRAKVYDDATGLPIGPGSHVVGHPTVGWGRALDIAPLTLSEALVLRENSEAAAIGDARFLVGDAAWSGLGVTRQAALANMAYQLGRAGLGAFRALIEAVRAGDWQAAHDAALDSRAARQAPARWRRNAAMLLTGAMPAVNEGV